MTQHMVIYFYTDVRNTISITSTNETMTHDRHDRHMLDGDPS